MTNLTDFISVPIVLFGQLLLSNVMLGNSITRATFEVSDIIVSFLDVFGALRGFVYMALVSAMSWFSIDLATNNLTPSLF